MSDTLFTACDPAATADKAAYGVLQRSGVKFMCELPPGFDHRTQLAACPYGGIVAAHPDHPPMYFNVGTQKWEEIVDTGAPPRADSNR